MTTPRSEVYEYHVRLILTGQPPRGTAQEALIDFPILVVGLVDITPCWTRAHDKESRPVYVYYIEYTQWGSKLQQRTSTWQIETQSQTTNWWWRPPALSRNPLSANNKMNVY